METDLVGLIARDFQYLRTNEKKNAYIVGVLTGMNVANLVIEWGLFRLEHHTLGKLHQGHLDILSTKALVKTLNGGYCLAEINRSFDESIMAGTVDLYESEERVSFFNGFDIGLSYLISFAWYMKSVSNPQLAQSEAKRWSESLKQYITVNYITK